VGEFDEKKLSYQWTHSDARVEELYQQARAIVSRTPPARKARWRAFMEVWNLARTAAGASAEEHLPAYAAPPIAARATVPYLNEAWFC
jgi:hypothetical protein